MYFENDDSASIHYQSSPLAPSSLGRGNFKSAATAAKPEQEEEGRTEEEEEEDRKGGVRFVEDGVMTFTKGVPPSSSAFTTFAGAPTTDSL